MYQSARGGGDMDFLLNHISGSFVNMVQWWIRGGARESPEELTAYFDFVTRPVLTRELHCGAKDFRPG